jgi:hypothetical protein
MGRCGDSGRPGAPDRVLREQRVDDGEHLRASPNRPCRIEPDLQVGAGGDSDDAVADLRDLLPCLDMLARFHQVRAGVSVIHLETLEGTIGDLQDRCVGAKAGDALADYHAVAHRVLGRASRS